MSSFVDPATLSDRCAIASLQNAYGVAIDRRDWETFRTLFTADVIATYPAGNYVTLDEWVDAFIEIHLKYTTTHHSMTNHLAIVDGDVAQASCYGVIALASARDSTVIDSRTVYEDQLIRRDGEWRIQTRRCHRQFWRVRAARDHDVIGPQLRPGTTIVSTARWR